MSELSALRRQLEASQVNLSQALAELADLKEIKAAMFSIVRMVRPHMREDETVASALQRIISEWQAEQEPPVMAGRSIGKEKENVSRMGEYRRTSTRDRGGN